MAIQMLMPTLQNLFKKGYKRATVVEFLRDQGIDCSEATLKTLYRGPKARKEKPGKADEGAPAVGAGERVTASAVAASPSPAATTRATRASPRQRGRRRRRSVSPPHQHDRQGFVTERTAEVHLWSPRWTG